LKTKCDIVHAHIPPPFVEFFSARARNKTKIPLVLTYHCDLELPNFLNRFVSSFYRRTFGYYSLIYTDKIIVTTNTYAATSRAVWRFPPIVIPNAVDTKTYNPTVDGSKIRKRHNLNGKKMILYVGRIKFHKGIEYFVSASKFFDKETGKRFSFLTNNFIVTALTIAELYKCRWQVEIFFKWIKQHLRIKAFYGTSENTVKTQIWIAISVYVLVAIVKKRLRLQDMSLYTILQILSVTLFEKTQLLQILTESNCNNVAANIDNQMKLFNY